MTRRNRIGLIVLGVLGIGFSVLLTSTCNHLKVRDAEAFFEPKGEQARLEIVEGVPILRCAGSGTDMGLQMAEAVGTSTKELIDAFLVLHTFDAEELEAARAVRPLLAPRHLAEMDTFAQTTGLEGSTLIAVNMAADSYCSAFAVNGKATADGAMIFARNMDFAPAHLLGPRTILAVFRPEGLHAFVAVTWPGYSAVISGMNDAGLCATVLVCYTASEPVAGPPVGFCLRELLEECTTVNEAVAAFSARPPSSGHFIMVADAQGAAVLQRGHSPRMLADHVLTCSNGPVDTTIGRQGDDRSCALSDLIEKFFGRIDDKAARQIIAATYLPYINAQCMIFHPATLELDLARGTTLAPAAENSFQRLNLSEVLRKADGKVIVSALAKVKPEAHFKEHDYEGRAIQRAREQARKLRQANSSKG